MAEAVTLADDAIVYDNSRRDAPFRVIARYTAGRPEGDGVGPWPSWAPDQLHPDEFAS